MSERVEITIDGRKFQADPKKPLIAACHESGVYVPMYCYHPGLRPVGSCRICQVDVKQGEMPARVMVACRTPVAAGMEVNTQAPKARDARRECLEFLLKNHPLDCPICDKAGECDLQDYAFNEGQGRGRSVEPRRQLDKRRPLGDVIVLDEERCILCGRCVRFFEEVTKKPQLTVVGIGAESIIDTFLGRPLEGIYQGNIADICPVGALTLRKFRFQARVWNLHKHLSTCGECSRGCAITIEVLRRQEVKRLRPRFDPEVNEWWMCDVGRFSFERFDERPRLGPALVRGARGLEPSERHDALDVVADAFGAHPHPVVVASPWLTVEEGELLRSLAAALGVEARFVSPPPSGLADEVLQTGDPCPNRRGLEELGLSGAPAEELLEELRGAGSALLVGERVAELLGAEALEELPAGLRLVALETRPLDVPAARVLLGVPNAAERDGTWINVAGIRRTITVAKPAPPGVPPLADTLEDLARRVAPPRPAEVGG